MPIANVTGHAARAHMTYAVRALVFRRSANVTGHAQCSMFSRSIDPCQAKLEDQLARMQKHGASHEDLKSSQSSLRLSLIPSP